MIKNVILPCLLAFLSVLQSAGQTAGCAIRVKIEGYNNDTLWFGHTYGKRGEPEFFALKEADGWFNLKNEAAMAAGMYAFLLKRGKASPDYEYYSCWLAEGQRVFTVETDIKGFHERARVSGSVENARLFPYLLRSDMLGDSLNLLTNSWKSLRTEAAFRAMVRAQEALRKYQENTLLQCKDAPMTAELIRQTTFLTPPPPAAAPKNWEAEAAARHAWMRAHFFERMDLGSGQFLKYPLWIERSDYYFSKLPPPEPDSMIVMIEDILHRLEPDQEAYQYYFRYMLNSMTKMSRYRTDEVFVYFVRNYVDKGKADWLGSDKIEKFRDDAARMEPLFVGKAAPDATFYDKNGAAVNLYSVKAPYTLMVFWMHDCSHCKKEIPIVEKLYAEYGKAKGMQVFSVCGASGEDKTSLCFDFAAQMNMPAEWLVVNDPLRRSRFTRLYDVRSYPRLIVLDADKRILFKHTGEAPEDMLNAEIRRMVE